MMPIVTLQRRLRSAGRIRLGAKVPTANGKSRPDKLASFRFTSPDRNAIEAVAEEFGGTVQQWEGAPVGTQWEVFAEAQSLDVVVPPTDIAFSQFFEDWTGGICRKRCDGVTNLIADEPCTCDPEKPDCRPTTRLNVMLAALSGIGVWRAESHGWNSASELSGSIEVLKAMQARGTMGAMVPGRLMLEQRQSKSTDASGKVQTFNFAVPVLDFNISVAALVSGERLPAVTPLARETPAIPSVAEQLLAATEAEPPPRRSNAAASIPRTGLKPRGLPTDLEEPAPSPSNGPTTGGASAASLRKLMAMCRGSDLVPNDDEARHEWAALALDRPVSSFTDLTQEEVSRLIDVAAGKTPLIADAPKVYADDDPMRPF
jgi:hypothetical protein